jgi:hypothetical protein
MKSIGILLGILLAGVASLQAQQVTVEVSLDQDYYIPGETLPARVRITNRSGQTMRLAAEPDWLSFTVQTLDGKVVPKLGEVSIEGEPTLLESAKRIALKPIDIAPAFAFDELGQYQVIATLHIHSWEQEISGRSKPFHMIRGVDYWSQDFGLPLTNAASGTNTAGSTNSANLTPEVRRYILQKADYLRGHLRLYLRVIAASGKNIGVANVGQLVSFSKPEAQIDPDCNLHVIYQDGPKTYLYAIYSPDAQLLRRQTFNITATRPTLAVDGQGRIGIAGGMRHEMRTDFPPPPPDSDDTPVSSGATNTTDEVKPPKS